MTEQTPSAALAPLTPLPVGGEAERLVTVTTSQELIEVSGSVWGTGDDWLILGGGSNVVIADSGFRGTVIRIASRGVERLDPVSDDAAGTARMRVQAGEPWDDFVNYSVENGFSGVEALSGIPGSVGAAPIQNIGAYGQELGSVLVGVEFLDRQSGEVRRLEPAVLDLGYRTSVFKNGLAGVVISIDVKLSKGSAPTNEGHLALGQPIEYEQLATALGVRVGDRVPVGEVRDAVLALRASKGMVLDPADPDSVSAGSFFTNPIVSENFARTLPTDAPRWFTEPQESSRIMPLEQLTDSRMAGAKVLPPRVSEDTVKLSAAWLIEQAGIGKGFSLPGSQAAISSKHTLAIINRGGATANEVAELARFIQSRVQAEFGVILQPEPVLVGLTL